MAGMTSSASSARGVGDLDGLATAPPDATRSYGADAAQVYDVRRPDPDRARDVTVLVVHGGFWRAAYDRQHTEPEARAFVDAGYDVAVAEYRRVGMPGGGVPGTLDDVRALVSAVRADPDLPHRIVLVGHSAGGHLVTWAANQPWADGLLGVVSLAGVVDLRAADGLHLGDDATPAFVGGPPSDTGPWDLADPMATLPPRVPVRLVVGSADVVVPPAVSDGYLARTAAAQADVTLDVVPSADHFDLIDPHSPAFAHVLAAVADLAP